MAAIFKGRAFAGSFGKRLAKSAAAKDHAPLPAISGGLARAHYSSSYDKNVEEEVRPAVVPDHVIGASNPGDGTKYWGPNPKTGVFGPPGGLADAKTSSTVDGASSAGASVLDQTAWFRPLEDVDKPAPNA